MPEQQPSKPPSSQESIVFILLRQLRGCLMGPVHKAVLLTLADYANEFHVAWPAYDTLMAACGCGRTQLRTVLADLEKYGWIRVLVRGDGRLSTRYRVKVDGRSIPLCREAMEAHARTLLKAQRRADQRAVMEGEDMGEDSSVGLPAVDTQGGCDNLPGGPETPPCGSGNAPNTLTQTLTETLNHRESRAPASHGLGSSMIEPIPPTNRSREMTTPPPTSGSRPSSPPRTIKLLIPPVYCKPGTGLATAQELLSWIGSHACLKALLEDEVIVTRWANDQAGIFACSGTRSSDVHDAVVAFVTQRSAESYEMPMMRLFGSVGVFLKNAKRYGDIARSQARKPARGPGANKGKVDRRQPGDLLTPRENAPPTTHHDPDEMFND